jgi:transcriptional regulator with XRE-family HTH domain
MFYTTEIKDVKKDIGKLIKTYRKQHKLTQSEIADRLDVSRNTIQNLEAGKNFTIDTLLKVLKELDLLRDLHERILQSQTIIKEPRSLY